MTKLSKANQIWQLTPTEEDLEKGARYAAITLPWTFNRMMRNTGSSGQKLRALSIAKGVVAQEMLRRVLLTKGIDAGIEEKSHRADDLFDFEIKIGGKPLKLDVKTMNHYNNYPNDYRDPFSPDIVIQNAGYSGPDWRYFFPLLIPHTQIAQKKEVYCFAIASSIDFRDSHLEDRNGYVLSAFPYGDYVPFFNSPVLIHGREAAQQGIYLQCSYYSTDLFGACSVRLQIIGEWLDAVIVRDIELRDGETVANIGPFSSVNCFRLGLDNYNQLFGNFSITVERNDFAEPVRNAAKRNVNVAPASSLNIGRDDFCNLILPTDYHLFVLGWITKQEFLSACRQYAGWVWPMDSEDRFKNRPWSQITENDERTLRHAGFEGAIQKNPSKINAGWMKTTGHGNGACCYVYPNTFNGGVAETNLYVLPQDLNIMDELGRQ